MPASQSPTTTAATTGVQCAAPDAAPAPVDLLFDAGADASSAASVASSYDRKPEEEAGSLAASVSAFDGDSVDARSVVADMVAADPVIMPDGSRRERWLLVVMPPRGRGRKRRATGESRGFLSSQRGVPSPRWIDPTLVQRIESFCLFEPSAKNPSMARVYRPDGVGAVSAEGLATANWTLESGLLTKCTGHTTHPVDVLVKGSWLRQRARVVANDQLVKGLPVVTAPWLARQPPPKEEGCDLGLPMFNGTVHVLSSRQAHNLMRALYDDEGCTDHEAAFSSVTVDGKRISIGEHMRSFVAPTPANVARVKSREVVIMVAVDGERVSIARNRGIGTVVGFLAYRYHYAHGRHAGMRYKASRVLTLEVVATRTNHRRRGIASRLISEWIQQVAPDGTRGTQLRTHAQPVVVNILRRCGFAPSSLAEGHSQLLDMELVL